MKNGKTGYPWLAAWLLTLTALLFSAGLCLAQIPAEQQMEQPEQQMAEAEEPSIIDQIQWLQGPATAEIDKWAEIKVPEGFLFANGDDTRLLMESIGNPATGDEVGFLAPDSLDWFVVFEFEESGYIKDDEKDSLDGDAILESIRSGTEEGNKIRRERGFTGLTIVGWEVPPAYNEKSHNLEWAIRAQDDDGELVLNHNTRILGRRGVMRVTLVVDPQLLASVLPTYRASLDEFEFKSGQRYAEYVQGDKLAQYGLTALVAGGAGAAAAKMGLFQMLAKFWKAVVLGVVAFFGALWGRIKRLFSRDKGEQVKAMAEETRSLSDDQNAS